MIPTDPPVGGTTSLIRSLIPSLGPSEGRVAQNCVESPDVFEQVLGIVEAEWRHDAGGSERRS